MTHWIELPSSIPRKGIIRVNSITAIDELGAGQLSDAFYITVGSERILIHPDSAPGSKLKSEEALVMRNELINIVKTGFQSANKVKYFKIG